MTQTIEAGANDVFLVGVVEKAPVFVYSERGYRMLEGMIAVERRSGNVDHLPFVGDEYLIEGMPAGRRFALGGRMHHRDRAKYPLSENRTVMSVESVAPDIDGWPDQNTVKLSGFVCRPPYYRETPFGREICELTIAVPRGNGQQDYIMSYLSSIVPVAKRNPGVISDLYTAISNNSETSLSASELIYIASSAVENLHSVSDIEIIRFDGEITAGINAEMHVKDEEVLSKMLDIFYEPINTGSTEATDSAVETAAPSVAAAESQTAAVTAEATQEEPTGAVQETQ